MFVCFVFCRVSCLSLGSSVLVLRGWICAWVAGVCCFVNVVGWLASLMWLKFVSAVRLLW